jgi:NitT/TauT family transport system substrate-binding protein
MSECMRGLAEGSVGAAVMWEPYISLAETIGAGKQIGDLESDDYLTGVVALSDWVRANEDAAVAYLKAHIRTHRFIRDNAHKAAQLIHSATGIPVQVAHRVISRVRWDAVPYTRDLQTLERLAVSDGTDEGGKGLQGFSAEPSYLLYAAGTLRLPPIGGSPLMDDWSREPW